MIHEALERLQELLHAFRSEDSSEQAQAADLHAHVQASMDGGDHAALSAQLEKALILFDDDHPDIASAIRTVIQIMSASGI
jgi:hypothetical protein